MSQLRFLLLLLAMLPASLCEAQMKSESFDSDPGWEGRNNQIAPNKNAKVTQDFGYTNTHFAAQMPGELGGTITRAFAPAFYAEKTTPRTLDDKFSASGTFALTRTTASGGFFFGWFNASQRGGSRPVGSLGMDFDCEKHGARLALRLITGQNQSCGTFITPFVPGTYRPTAIRNDGTRYHWKMSYEPATNGAKAHFDFSITSDAAKHEFFEGTNFHVEVPDAFKNENTVLDRFGLMNIGRPGGHATVYFGDLACDGQKLAFESDPGWDGAGNRIVYEPEESKGAHRYGYSAKTSFAGGAPGEIGGTVWRTESDFGWYADRVGPLNLDGKLEAQGRVMLAVGAPDSAVALGWFNSHSGDDIPANKTNFVGVMITGPTRVGHYFLPAFANAEGHHTKVKKGPVVVPGKPYDFKLIFDPTANDGNGAIHVTLGNETASLNLKPGQRQEGAQFDRFGIVSVPPGGGLVKIYFDDLKYTAGQTKP